MGLVNTFGACCHHLLLKTTFVANWKKTPKKWHFWVQMDLGLPNGRKWVLGCDFVWNPLRCEFCTTKFFFVSNTSTPHFTSTRKWVPRENFDEKCPKSPKNRLFWKSLRNSQSDLWSWNFTKTALWGLKKLKNRIFVIFGFFDPPGPTLEKFVAENFGKKPKMTIFQVCAWWVHGFGPLQFFSSL